MLAGTPQPKRKKKTMTVESNVIQFPTNNNQNTSETSIVVPKLEFDLEKLRLSQDFAAKVGVKKALLTVPVRKPDRHWFVRVHPDKDYRLQTGFLQLKGEDQELYLVHPSLWSDLPDVVRMELFTAINRQNVLFLWPVGLPGQDGRYNEWHRSAAEAVAMAMQRWIKVQSNKSLGAYEVFEPIGKLPEPEWPDLSFQSILETAFKNRYITTPDHPVLRRLRGEA